MHCTRAQISSGHHLLQAFAGPTYETLSKAVGRHVNSRFWGDLCSIKIDKFKASVHASIARDRFAKPGHVRKQYQVKSEDEISSIHDQLLPLRPRIRTNNIYQRIRLASSSSTSFVGYAICRKTKSYRTAERRTSILCSSSRRGIVIPHFETEFPESTLYFPRSCWIKWIPDM